MKAMLPLLALFLIGSALVNTARAESDRGTVLPPRIVHEAEFLEMETVSGSLTDNALLGEGGFEHEWDAGCKGTSCSGCCCNCCCGPSLYASINLAGTFSQQRAGGFNTGNIIGFQNHPDSVADESFGVGGALGVAIPRNFGTLRLEAQGMYYDTIGATTGSYPGPPSQPTYFYQTTTKERWSLLANAWYDVPVGCCPIELYFGGGLGGGGGVLYTTDTEVHGQRSYTSLVWQVGCGVTYHHNNRLAIDLGYRYVDYGKADVSLYGGNPATPAGNYTSDLTAHQIMLSFRFNALRDFLPNR